MTSGSQVHRGSDSRIVEFCMTLLTQAGSPLKASALRDIERGAPTEGEHVLGDMVARARSLGVETPILDLARTHVGKSVWRHADDHQR
jgi:ketopantoate reductase